MNGPDSLPSESIRPQGVWVSGKGTYRRGSQNPGKLAQWEAAIALTTDACFCNYVIHARR